LNNAASTDYCKYNRPDSDLEKNAKETALILFSVFGLCSNIFIIVLAVKYTARKNLHHLIVNMAVSDALFLMNCFLFQIIKVHLGDTICKILFFVYEISYKVALVTLLVISIERFRATRQTLQRSRPYTIKQRVAVLGICWLIPMVLAASWCYAAEYDDGSNECEVPLSATGKELISFTTSFFTMTLAIFIIFALSIISIKRLSRTQAIESHLNKEHVAIRKKRVESSISMVLASTLLYVGCWFPHTALWCAWIVSLYIPNVFDSCIDIKSVKYISIRFLPSANACFSPFIYIIFLDDFQAAAKRVLRCCKTSLGTIQRPTNEMPLQHIQQEEINHAYVIHRKSHSN